MQKEIKDVIQSITQDIDRNINKIQELSKEKMSKATPTWDDAIQLSNLEKHLSKIINQYK
jgi:hypothetical protein